MPYPYSENLTCLARAFAAGEQVTDMLHDALVAEEFACLAEAHFGDNPCPPGKICFIINLLLGQQPTGATNTLEEAEEMYAAAEQVRQSRAANLYSNETYRQGGEL